MRTIVLLALISISYAAVVYAARLSLPFSVKFGGHFAKAESDKAVAATVPDAIGADAAVEVSATSPQVIMNVTEADERGQPIPGKPTAILLLPNGKGSLSNTMDKKPLNPGRYLASLIAGGKTARVLFTVK